MIHIFNTIPRYFSIIIIIINLDKGPDDQEHNTLQHLTIVFFMRKTREI